MDSTIVLQNVNAMMEGDKELEIAIKRNYMDTFYKKYPIAAYNNDSTSVVFDDGIVRWGRGSFEAG